MPKLDLTVQSQHSKEKTTDLIQTMFENDSDLQKLDSGYTSQFDRNSGQGEVKGSKFKANVNITGDENSSAVTIRLEIGLMLTPFKKQITEGLEKKMNQALS